MLWLLSQRIPPTKVMVLSTFQFRVSHTFVVLNWTRHHYSIVYSFYIIFIKILLLLVTKDCLITKLHFSTSLSTPFFQQQQQQQQQLLIDRKFYFSQRNVNLPTRTVCTHKLNLIVSIMSICTNLYCPPISYIKSSRLSMIYHIHKI